MDEPEILKLAHRDDFDMEVIAEIEKHFAETHPGMKVVFAGDQPGAEVPEELKEMLADLQKLHEASLTLGLCLDCGANMPDYDPEREGWEPTEGWRWFSDAADNPVGWQCPECDAKDEANGLNQ